MTRAYIQMLTCTYHFKGVTRVKAWCSQFYLMIKWHPHVPFTMRVGLVKMCVWSVCVHLCAQRTLPDHCFGHSQSLADISVACLRVEKPVKRVFFYFLWGSCTHSRLTWERTELIKQKINWRLCEHILFTYFLLFPPLIKIMFRLAFEVW